MDTYKNHYLNNAGSTFLVKGKFRQTVINGCLLGSLENLSKLNIKNHINTLVTYKQGKQAR